MPSARPFPSDFTFGVATSAYQVEGGIHNDWSLWEEAGRLHDPRMRCGLAVDHWNPARFEGDLRLAKDVGAKAFRLSLEWARIEPAPGRFDEAVIETYRQRLLRMREVGLRPFVTLHHFTHPTWFAGLCPWHEPKSVDAFRRYAKQCARIVAGLEVPIIPFNEPMVLLLGGYLQGVIPPGIADAGKVTAALANLVRSHVAAREEIRVTSPGSPFGTSQNVLAFAPDRAWHPLDRALVRLAQENYNHAFLRAVTSGELRVFMPGVASTKVRVEGAQDSVEFVGLNYYSRAHLRFVARSPFLKFGFRDPHGRGLTDIGWEQYPEGFSQLIGEAHRAYGLPIWITENGMDDRTGRRRPRYLYEHWRALLDAVDAGADVRGYLYWSLLDNFEWLEGWGPRFGLYRVDFETLERTATPACRYFHKVATSGVLTEPESEPAP